MTKPLLLATFILCSAAISYHVIAQDKYARLGREYSLGGLEPPSRDHLEAAANRLRGAGLRVNIGG